MLRPGATGRRMYMLTCFTCRNMCIQSQQEKKEVVVVWAFPAASNLRWYIYVGECRHRKEVAEQLVFSEPTYRVHEYKSVNTSP